MGLTKRHDGYYAEYRVVDDGQVLRLAAPGEGTLKRWKVGTNEKRIALTQAAVIKTGLLSGSIKSPAIERPLLFADWIEKYLTLPEVAALRSAQRRPLILRRFSSLWKGRTLISLRPEDVYDYRSARAAEGIAVGTVNYEHALLKACLNVALRLRLIQYNPAALVPLPDPQNARKRVLSPDEFTQIETELKDNPNMWAAFLLGHDGGMRVSEVSCVTLVNTAPDFSSVSLAAHETKTREARIVPLTRRAGYALAQASRTPHSVGRIFPSGQRISKRFTALARKLKLEDVRFHDTRHCARTNLRRAGVDTETTMKWLGHKTMVTSLRYDTVTTDDLQRGLSKLNDSHGSNTLITPGDQRIMEVIDKSTGNM